MTLIKINDIPCNFHQNRAMEIYLVGGAVRDRLLGLPVTEHDWVVVGATEEDMRRLGYRSVGKDFPVFLHPETKQEYALARTERKVARGHKGFECTTDSVTLEDDLKRRDLTINAIAEDRQGRLIDPWGGEADLRDRVLRHVSEAFEEDPLRVLRVARFAARFHTLGFAIHPSTLSLMRAMTERGELSELTPERVWIEFEKALATDSPAVFLEVLDQVNAGSVLWPEISTTSIARLAELARRTSNPIFRYAALLLELSPEQGSAISTRLRVPNRLSDFARLAARYHADWTTGRNLAASKVISLLYALDAFRQPARFRELNEFFRLATAGADATAAQWEDWFETARNVTAGSVDPQLTGSEIGEAIKAEQARRVELNR